MRRWRSFLSAPLINNGTTGRSTTALYSHVRRSAMRSLDRKMHTADTDPDHINIATSHRLVEHVTGPDSRQAPARQWRLKVCCKKLWKSTATWLHLIFIQWPRSYDPGVWSPLSSSTSTPARTSHKTPFWGCGNGLAAGRIKGVKEIWCRHVFFVPEANEHAQSYALSLENYGHSCYTTPRLPLFWVV